MSETAQDGRNDDTPTTGIEAPQEGREARVNRDGDGEAVGVAIFLTADELRDLGVSPEETDRVSYGVDNGRVRVHSANNGSGE